MNKVILMGNLTRNPEVRFTAGSKAICGFGLALNRKYKDGSGQLKDDTTFVDCEAWGQTAENIGKYFSKGRPILIEGRLKLDTWEDKKDGSKRSKLKVVVDNFEFAGGGGDKAAAPSRAAAPAASPDDGGADIPF